MATESVQPLNIVKNGTPTKPSRPLAEIGSNRKMLLHRDSSESSAFDPSSPFHLKSPRLFWEDRATLSPPVDSENSPERSISPEISKRRSSIENLKKASRVKNSSMYARETKDNYDPSSSPMIERPLNNRPWGGHLQNNVFARNDSLRKENSPFRSPTKPPHNRSESANDVPCLTPTKRPAHPRSESTNDLPTFTAASRLSPQSTDAASPPRSPVRSSMAANSRFSPAFDPEASTWSEMDDEFRASTPRAQPRHAKSVTFQNSPPEVNEYEDQTPEPSSIASDSREGSYDSYDEDDDDNDDDENDDDQDDSFDRDDGTEHDDSFDASLEDTDKTPVVLPEDWRHISPSSVRTDLVDDHDDVFDERGRGSPSPTATPTKHQQSSPFRTQSGASAASDGSDFRPLPPIPGFASSPRRGRGESPRGLSLAAERASSSQRGLPTPPLAASVSKDEILRMREATMSLEDRMGLMALQESLAEVHKARNASVTSLQPAAGAAEGLSADKEPAAHENQQDHDQEFESEYFDDLADYDVAPSISRESILRNVKSNRFDDYDEFTDDHSALSSPGRDYADLANLDPDVAIPSRENSTNFGDEVVIKEEMDESFMDLDAIPALVADDNFEQSPSRFDEYERDSSVIHHQIDHDEDEGEDETQYDDDDESRYSSPMFDAPEGHLDVNEGTPRASVEPTAEVDASLTPLREPTDPEHSNGLGLPLLGNLNADGFDFGLKEHITPSPPASSHGEEKDDPTMTGEEQHDSNSILNPPELFKPTDNNQDDAPHTPTEEIGDGFSDVGSFDSAIHDSITEEMLPVEADVPERRATIKTQGKLRARPSGTPADLQAMIQQRRLVSLEVPPIPAQYRNASLSGSDASEMEDQETTNPDSEDGTSELEETSQLDKTDDSSESSQVDSLTDKDKRRQSRKQLKLDLDLPVGSLTTDTGLGLMEEFDRVIESQKKGYLMRQNTKVVIASNRNFSNESQMSQRPQSPPHSPTLEARPSSRGTRSAGNSPRKASAGEKWLTAEPWNGKTRRKSTRKSSGRKSNVGPAPSAGQGALGTVDELMATDEADENTERGRLFVKVVGVKDLDLPLPRNDRLYFQLTLDNGLHCVTTGNLELNKSAPVGQEFELVVLTDLEFQLTLTTKLPPAPKPQQAASVPAPQSPTKPTKPNSVFSRLLSSPKKRAERERKEREEVESAERRRQQEEAERKKAAVKRTPWDYMREVVDAKTGSFARSYVSLKSHEAHCFGRPLTVDVPCFNEWALEKDANVVSSVRSKRNNGGLAYGRADGAIRRPPYTIGKLELQLLYIPRPKDATDEDMPRSMSSALREISAAEQVKEVFWEGSLSQQGGDCPYWRRRYFKLQGTKLTAYHEATMQPRATINLSKASKLIDDKSSLVADPNGGNPTSRARRKSAFAEDDEGYQFVEDGFRIRFANGETIDFYADNYTQKDDWMKALAQSVGKAPAGKKAKWTDVVLAKERLDGKGKSEIKRKPTNGSNASTTNSAPNSPVISRSNSTRPGTAPTVPDQDGATTPPTGPRTGHRQRNQVKSMIF